MPLAYIDEATMYKKREFPFAEIAARAFYIKSYREIMMLSEKYGDMVFLIKQLSWYECDVKNRQKFPNANLWRKMLQTYAGMESQAQKALIEYYFNDALRNIRHELTSRGKGRNQ